MRCATRWTRERWIDERCPCSSVEGLRVAFGDKEVVHGVDFELAPGEKLALVGESGSGKTVTALSLLRLRAGRPGVGPRALCATGATCWPCPSASCAAFAARRSP